MNMANRQPTVPMKGTAFGIRKRGRKLKSLRLCFIRTTTLIIPLVIRKNIVTRGATAFRFRNIRAKRTMAP
jgi:hypothetical protein